jgi:hypothetical protein
MNVECKASCDHRGRARILPRPLFQIRKDDLPWRTEIAVTAGRRYLRNYIDINTGLEYWVSGPKRNGQDRHWAGGGEVRVDPDVVDEYWRDIRQCDPPKNPFVA